MLDYHDLKLIHVSCVVLSLSGFLLRGGMMLAGSPLLRARLVRIAPHVIDTLLLLSGIGLSIAIEQYPGEAGWLNAKLLALCVYIGLGMVALRPANARAIRAGAFLAAGVCAAYIVAVAFTKQVGIGFWG